MDKLLSQEREITDLKVELPKLRKYSRKPDVLERKTGGFETEMGGLNNNQTRQYSTSSGDVVQSRNLEHNSEKERLPDANEEEKKVFEPVAIATGNREYERGDKDATTQPNCETEKYGLMADNVFLKRKLEMTTKVNKRWHQFWTKQKMAFDKILKEKDTIIANLRQSEVDKRMKAIELMMTVEKNQMEKEKDDILLLTKARIDKMEKTIEQLRSDVIQTHHKNECAQKFARSLLKQKEDLEREVKRLNGILETKIRDQTTLTTPVHNLDSPHANKPDIKEGAIKPTLLNDLNSPPLPAVRPKQKEHRVLHIKAGHHHNSSAKDTPCTKRKKNNDHDGNLNEELGVNGQKRLEQRLCESPAQQRKENSKHDNSLTKEELKERVMMLKAHVNTYESDFRHERRDKENIVGQLQNVKQDLNATKQKLKQQTHHTHQQTPHFNIRERSGAHGHHVYDQTKKDNLGTREKNRQNNLD